MSAQINPEVSFFIPTGLMVERVPLRKGGIRGMFTRML
jgi:hypothetical protein